MSPTPGLGLASFFAMVTESVVGTDPGSGYDYHRIVSGGWKPTAEVTRGNRGLGRLGASSMVNRLERSEGGLLIDPQYEGMELLLLHLCGGVDTYTADSPVASAYKHVFAPSVARQVGLSVHMNEDISMTAVTGIKLGSLAAVFSNENLEMNFGGIGQVHAASTTVDTPTYPTAPDVLALEGTPGTDGLVVTLSDVGGGSPVVIDPSEVTVDFNLPLSSDREGLGSPVMKESVPTDIMAVTGQITREFEDDTFADLFRLRTAKQLSLKYQSTQMITGATPYDLELKLYAIIFQGGRPDIEGGGVLPESIPFTAYVEGANWFDWTLHNSLVGAIT